MSLYAYAKSRGYSRQWIYKLRDAGVLPLDNSGRVIPSAADQAIAANISSREQTDKKDADEHLDGDVPSGEDLSLVEAKRRHEFWKSEERRLEVERRRGDLVETGQVTYAVAILCRTMVDAIYAAQDRLARHFDSKTASRVRREFDKAIDGIGTAAQKTVEKISTPEN